MTTTLTASIAAAIVRSYARPRYLVQIELAGLTLRFCDDFIVALGYEWQPYVLAFGALEAVMTTVDVSGRPRTTEITLRNNRAVQGVSRLSDLMRPAVGGYEFLQATCTVILALGTTETANGVVTYEEARREVFYLEEPTEITAKQITFAMSDKSLVIENKCLLQLIDRTTFRDASPQAIGQRVPAYFGTTPSVPILWVQAGGYSLLAAPMTAGATTASVNETDPFAAASNFLAQIDSEAVLFGSGANGILTVASGGRGRGGTKAVLHAQGAGVYELRQGSAAYKGIVAQNLAADFSLKHARAGNVIAPQGSLTGLVVNMDDRTLVAGKSFVTVSLPGFTMLPLSVSNPTANSGQTPFSVTRAATNAPVSSVTAAVATATAVMPALGVPNPIIKGVTYTVKYRFLFGAGIINILGFRATYQVAGGAFVPFGGVNFFGDSQIVIGHSQYGNFAIRGDDGLGAPVQVVINSVVATVDGLQSATGAAVAPPLPPVTNSTADVVWGTLACDVAGILDDAGGSYTGSPAAPITNPADVTPCVLRTVYPLTGAADIGATFAATRALLAAGGYVWAARIDGAVPFSTLRRMLGEQSRCVLHLEAGLWQMVYLTQGPAAIASLDSDVAMLADSVKISKTPMTDIVNSLHVFSEPDLRRSSGLSAYKRSKVFEDLAYPIQYSGGALNDRVQRDLELPFIQAPATADALGAFWLAEWKRPRVLVEGTTFWNVMAWDNYDPVSVTDDPVLATWSGLVFRVVGRRYLLNADNPGRIGLILREANT